MSSAKELNIKYPEFNFATLDGDLVNASGIVEAGSSPKSDETLFGRKKLLEDLKADYPKYENNLEKLKLQIQKTEEQISSIDLNTLSERGKILLNDINNIEKQISQFEFEKEKTSEEIEKSQTEINELAGELNRLDNELISHKSDLDQNIILREGIENKIAYARQFYNDSALGFNNIITTIPGMWFAGKRKEREYFKISEEEKKPVKVKFE